MQKTILICAVLISTLGIAQNSSITNLIADFERNKTMTLSYIEAMPEDQFNFKPTDAVRSFAQQMLHLAQGTIRLSANGSGEAPIYSEKNLEEEAAFQSKSEVRRLVIESFDFAIAGLQNMDPAKIDEAVVRGPFNVSRIGWIQKAAEHLAHHRGQCAIYLRLKGITPPQYKLF